MRRKKRCRVLMALAALLAVIGVVIGVAVAVSNQRTASNKQTSALWPTSAPTVDITGCVDAPPGTLYSPRYNDFRALVLNHSMGEPTKVDEPGSPQRHALCWIAEGDGLDLSAERSNLPAILQRYTLAVLYYGLVPWNQTTGLAETNFLTDVDECQWEGVHCNTSSTVTSIELYNQELSGSFPAEIINLKMTGTIACNGNAINALPAEIWKMTWLDYIDFGVNQLAMSIPTDIGDLTRLRTLKLDTNDNINGSLPTELFTLTKLELISLQRNKISGSIPSSIGALNKLKILVLASNRRLSGTIPTEIGLLTNLEILNLADHAYLQGTIPSEIGLLTQLTFLDLSQNRLEGTVPSILGNLINATSICLYKNTQLTGSVPKDLCDLLTNNSMRVLNVDGTEVNCACACNLGSCFD